MWYSGKCRGPGQERTINVLKFKNGKLTDKQTRETYGKEKARLVPTDVGTVVNDFLLAELEGK